MSKFHYLPCPEPVEAYRVERLGATPGYLQIETGEVVKGWYEAEEGDYLIYHGQDKVELVPEAEFNRRFYQPPDDLDPDVIESMIKDVDFVPSGELTVCVLTLDDGRKVVGSDNGPNGETKVRQQLAYASAIAQLFRYEIWALQGAIARVNSHDD